MENKNFILPETENTINLIIAEITMFFDISRILATAVYVVYLALRLAFFSPAVWMDAILVALYVAQTVFNVFDFFKKIRLERIRFILNVTKRLAAIVIFVLFIADIFRTYKTIELWQIIIGIFMGIGWILLVAGDIYQATAPRYSEMVLASFKNDIEVGGLVSRGFSEAKKEVKEVLSKNKNKAVAAGGIAVLASAIGFFLKKLLGKRG